jgi:hypothetical protein
MQLQGLQGQMVSLLLLVVLGGPLAVRLPLPQVCHHSS